jgi:hypothetical protein
MKRRRKEKIKFASDEKVAALRLLDDYDLARPWDVLSGAAGQAAINAAGDRVEQVEIEREDSILADTVAVDANGGCYVFVRNYL